MTLRELRTLKGWTQKDLAAKAGVSLEVIFKMETGKGSGRTFVSLVNAKKVADTLGITLDGLYEILSSDTEAPKAGNNTLKYRTARTRTE